MPDLLVKLYDLPPLGPVVEELKVKGIELKRPIGPEKLFVVEWVKENFGLHWASETDMCFSNKPVSVFVALDLSRDGKIVGFACYDATARGFFGPTGVVQNYRGLGIGRGLLLACLHDMYSVGYAYQLFGDAGPVEYYKKAVGAIEIPDSSPGIYRNMIRGF